MKPQAFDGKETINSFLAHFQVCAEFNDWTEVREKAVVTVVVERKSTADAMGPFI